MTRTLMKSPITSLILALSLLSIMGLEPLVGKSDSLPNEWLFADLSAWDNDVIEGHHRMAHSLGYAAVAVGGHREMGEYSRDLWFYLNDPHKNVQPDMSVELTPNEVEELQNLYPRTFESYPELPRGIIEDELRQLRNSHKEIFNAIKADFERTKCWSPDGDKNFPNNIAQLQQWGSNGNAWEPCPDFQQQAVVEAHVHNTIRRLKELENTEKNFLAKGIVIDVIEIWEEFNWRSTRGVWGDESASRYTPEREGITHEYATLREGWFQYLAQLRDAMDTAFPGRDVKYIWEPTIMYRDWVAHLPKAGEGSITEEILEKTKGDALVNEKLSLNYLMDERMQEHGWDLSTLGTVTGDLLTKNPYYPIQLKYFGEIAARGGWFFTYGIFDRSRRPISAYGDEFTLIRALSGWENMHQTSTEDRVWDTEQKVYSSPYVYADMNSLAGIHPRNGDIYGVILNENGHIPLARGVDIDSFSRVNEYWEDIGRSWLVEVSDQSIRVTGAEKGDYPISFIASVPDKGGYARLSAPKGLVLKETLTKENLIVKGQINSDFEQGSVGWSGPKEANVVAVGEPVYEGSQALQIYGRQMAWHGPSTLVTGTLMSGLQGKYRIKIMVRPESTDDVFTARIRYKEVSGSQVYDLKQFAEAGEWTEISGVFDLDWEDWVSDAHFMVQRKDAEESFYIDAFEIEKVN